MHETNTENPRIRCSIHRLATIGLPTKSRGMAHKAMPLFFCFAMDSEFLNSFATHLSSAFRIVAFKAHSITSPGRAPYLN
jgi:hypothetical protein